MLAILRMFALLVVVDVETPAPVSFAQTVLPTLTRLGCNAGACHGKASGRNGFRLSLFASDPKADHASLTREGAARRISRLEPDRSLLLLKPTGQVPHGGGLRLERGSPEYADLRRWIAQGAPVEVFGEAAIASLEVQPARVVVRPNSTQQLRVIAVDAAGRRRDVTRLALFQSNAVDLAEVDERGMVRIRDGLGQAAVMARFGGLAGVSRLTLPLGDAAPRSVWPSAENLVDRHVAEGWRALGLTPSADCTDGEFARRSSLDIGGRLPTVEDVAALEKETRPDKRTRWVDRLLDHPSYADRFAMTWSAILKNQRTLGPLSQAGTFAFHDWIRQSLEENKPYDRFVAEILTAQGDAAENPAVVWYRQASTVEAQVDDTAQLFLGVRLQCARCHHHPYERWGQDDYQGYAGFFTRVGRKPSDDPVTPRIFVAPATSDVPRPRILGAAEPLVLPPGYDPRRALADWLRRPDNPYFARALVNRTWKHFFGRGLVEPEDDLRASNPPTHPELLDALAEDFVAHGYDFKRLARTLATSRTYALSSVPNDRNARDRQAYSRFRPRPMPAEVLLDAVNTVAGVSETFEGLPRGTLAVQLPDEGFDTAGRFLEAFGRPRRASVCECERIPEPNLAQRLHLLNSAEVERKVSAPEGRAARLAGDARSDALKLVELYRVALARSPTASERRVCLEQLARRPGRAGWEDLVWSLINAREFAFVE